MVKKVAIFAKNFILVDENFVSWELYKKENNMALGWYELKLAKDGQFSLI
ncbi:hypothetical protein AAUPMC_05562 [Pasteurella multocida subsp. multocida str. Anand1_cattle]|nr:hypothetical protein AAUPMC_05562 [Pasteurella multocida subsp. multocida str. Anand1_cattle]